MRPADSKREATPDASVPTDAEQAALDWFALHQRGMTPAQEEEFKRWRGAHPESAAVFDELAGTWALLSRAGAAPTAVPNRRRATRFAWFATAAAAAAIALAYAGWWRPAHFSRTVITAVGESRMLALPDGSRIALNTDSALTVVFSPGERRLRLERGEAHFNVARNPARPLVVAAGGVAVRALGTAFNVRMHAAHVEVLVTEGRVSVAPVAERLPGPDAAASGDTAASRPPSETSPTVLAAGERASVAIGVSARPVARSTPWVKVVPVAPGEMPRHLAWQERKIDFESASLAEMVAEFNRYHHHRLVIADARLAERRFGGSFRIDDQAGFVRMLQENFGVVAETGPHETRLTAAP